MQYLKSLLEDGLGWSLGNPFEFGLYSKPLLGGECLGV